MPQQADYLIPFEVTQEDIDNGGTGPSDCPIAIAIRRVVDRFTMVGWYNIAIYWGDSIKITKNYNKPVPVSYSHRYMDWIRSNDRYEVVEPFKGVLERER